MDDEEELELLDNIYDYIGNEESAASNILAKYLYSQHYRYPPERDEVIKVLFELCKLLNKLFFDCHAKNDPIFYDDAS